MPSLSELKRLVGFFSYSRRDDECAGGALSALRARIRNELGLQLGRDIKLWQDAEAIPHGTHWEDEIRKAIAESVFFIPIVTPGAVQSPHCGFEFHAFLQRESSLARSDLVFPVLYVSVPALASDEMRRQSEILKIIHDRQFADWTKIRQEEVSSPAVGKKIEHLCEDIAAALRRPCPRSDENREDGTAESAPAKVTATAGSAVERHSKSDARPSLDAIDTTGWRDGSRFRYRIKVSATNQGAIPAMSCGLTVHFLDLTRGEEAALHEITAVGTGGCSAHQYAPGALLWGFVDDGTWGQRPARCVMVETAEEDWQPGRQIELQIELVHDAPRLNIAVRAWATWKPLQGVKSTDGDPLWSSGARRDQQGIPCHFRSIEVERGGQ